MTKEASAEQKPPVSEDLSKAIDQSIERQPDEQVKSVRLFGNYYRCNWWVPDKTGHAQWNITSRIRRSSFLRVTKPSANLLIEELSENR
jgi:hypothetical protein